MTVPVPRLAGFPLMVALAFALGGCSIVGSMRPPNPEVAAPDTTAVPVAPEPGSRTAPPSGGADARKSPKAPPVAARPAAPDSTAVAVPEPAPTITIRLSAEERAARETQFQADVNRAARALTAVRGRALSKVDLEELTAADQFLADARRAFEASDLSRACSVAEKARVLAEELRARLTPP